MDENRKIKLTFTNYIHNPGKQTPWMGQNQAARENGSKPEE